MRDDLELFEVHCEVDSVASWGDNQLASFEMKIADVDADPLHHMNIYPREYRRRCHNQFKMDMLGDNVRDATNKAVSDAMNDGRIPIDAFMFIDRRLRLHPTPHTVQWVGNAIGRVHIA